MAFLAELQSKQQRLKKVETDDRSSGLRAGYSTEAEVQRLREMWRACSVDAWEDLLGDATFESHYVPVTWAEGRELVALCERVDRWKNSVGQAAWAAHDDAVAAAGVTAEDTAPLAGLVARIDAKLAEAGLAGGAFAKTSLRSAKDVVTARLRRAFAARASEEMSLNDKTALLVQLGAELMRVSSGAEVLDMFLQSERVLGDICSVSEGGEKAWALSVVLRRWFNVQTSLEFRCFVHRNQMTALTQYNYFVHYPAVVAHKPKILALIHAFFEARCRSQLCGLATYVIDFAIYSEDPAALDGTGYPTQPVVRSIEVNPFAETTGAALFHWNRDRALLEGSAEPDTPAAVAALAPGFEFRVTESVPTRFELEPEYTAILDGSAAAVEAAQGV